MILTYIELVIAALLLGGCGVTYRTNIKRLKAQKSSLDYLVQIVDEERTALLEEKRRREQEEKLQKNRIFQLDFKIMHGSAFGGCSAINPNGKHRKGSISLDQVKMFGKNPSGQDFTYYIEDQGISILARDDTESLTVRSDGRPFEIREADEGRDEGVSATETVIRRDVLYYLILESKHEISILASKAC